ncbi:uncharacterized protein EDB93DRAFT_1104723 [Suillus bovinus]|uniref:uncharacterized protein n=1 Tax=Suillus bovinus TaxID=48563 RepID=UPI001B868E16|nr:uncharacterized protein EDB93DRAFT_1104723 [Suillus bovinus]KAG2145484.1 hypothetical protein EDB93DRAFT_1104723 [Suillus bovinus]
MPSHYTLHSQYSASQASIEVAPNTRMEKSTDSHVDGSILKPGHSFNNVIQMRADIPQSGTEVVSAGALSTEDTPSSYKTSIVPNPVTKVLDNPFISSSESSDESEVDTSCKTVKYSHKRLKRVAKVSAVEIPLPKADLVKEAEKLLTVEEKQCILKRRHTEMNVDSHKMTESSYEEGPFNLKGKRADPWNWGNVNLDESKIYIEAQKEALETWTHTHQWAKGVQQKELVSEGSDKENKNKHSLKHKLEKRDDPPTKKVKIKTSKKKKSKRAGKELRGANTIEEMIKKNKEKTL